MQDVLVVGEYTYYRKEFLELLPNIVKQIMHEVREEEDEANTKVFYEELAVMVNIEQDSVGKRLKRLGIPTHKQGHRGYILKVHVEKFKGNK